MPEERPLTVLALGGNALSPPTEEAVDDYGIEREIVQRTGVILNRLIRAGHRLLIVHGNGPQVGRLLRQDPAHGNLDIHVAQTQGELGYLLCAALEEPGVCVLTRVEVGDDPGPPVKPIGPVLPERPEGMPSTEHGGGWRVTVASPAPDRIIERAAIAELLETHHVVAGGGGGIPLDPTGAAVAGVVDKDRVAALLAVELAADRLVFATDVPGVYPGPDQLEGAPLARLSVDRAQRLVGDGSAAAGSMGPKLESAVRFAIEQGRPALICALEEIESALDGSAGSRVG
jgi:carbamate kinase